MPGGNPYRGAVEQALSAAQLPAEVVREIGERAARGWVRDQVEISRTGIRTLDHRGYFGKNVLAMGFGNKLCFGMQVNFEPGHIEYASLYEITDERGQTDTAMVPCVCQNVAVLGERAEEEEDTPKLPEPASWTLVMLALAALAWACRRGTGARPR